jgi:MYXO-CTERM domain-containing protein
VTCPPPDAGGACSPPFADYVEAPGPELTCATRKLPKALPASDALDAGAPALAERASDDADTRPKTQSGACAAQPIASNDGRAGALAAALLAILAARRRRRAQSVRPAQSRN